MTDTSFAPCTVSVRIKLSAAWASMLFVFAYVDLFSLYRADFRADLEHVLTIIAGAIGEWTYYLLGSAVEVALLAAVAHYAWTWPRSYGSDDRRRVERTMPRAP